MTTDHNDIYNIVERLAILEGRITPTTVKKGLNPQQKSVPQLPALFKPKHISVLKSKTDPEHPMHGYAVGSSESAEDDREPVEETMATEDVLEKVRKSFTDFIKQVEKINDTDLKDKKHEDSDLKNKDKIDRDLIAKVVKHELEEDPTEDEPGSTDQMPTTPTVDPTLPESKCVKSLAMEDGVVCEIHGNEHDGFEIRRGHRSLPTKFRDIDQAEMALRMFQHRRRKNDEQQDYLEEK